MKALFFVSIFFLFASLFGVYHQDWVEYFDSEIYECEIHDGLLYVITQNEGLSVFSYSNDQLPELIATYPDIVTYHLCFDGQYAYEINYSIPINKYDISDPENIEFIGSIQAPTQLVNQAINDIYIKDNLLCIASYYESYEPHNHFSDTYIDIFDIQDLSNINHLDCIFAYFCYEGERAYIHYLNSANYLYVTSYSNLDIYDCNDLQNISQQGSFYIQTPVFVNENYVVDRFSNIYQFDSNISITQIDDLNKNAYSAFQNDNLIIINESNSVSHFYDLNTNEIIDHYWCYNHKPCYEAELMFLADENILQGIDIRYPDNQDILYHLNDYANDFKIENNNIFFDIDNGIGVIDLNDTQFTLHEIVDDNYDDFLIADNKVLTFNDHYVYHDFKLHDIEDLNNIILLNSFQFNEIGDPYIVFGDLVYCFQSGTLKIVSITDPANPTIINEISFNNQSYRTFKNIDSLLYMFGNGTATVDISDPANPIILMETVLPSNPYSNCKVFFIQDFAYLYSNASDHILHIYDYSDPVNPIFISTIDSLYISRIFMINGNLAGVKDDFNEIRFYELIDHIPCVSSKYHWNNTSYCLAEYDNYILAACRDFGIYALSMDITPIDDLLMQPDNKFNLINYPNPFNPSTDIAFSLSAQNSVELSIYNCRGQFIKQLIADKLSAGKHLISWDGDDRNRKSAASGIYFIRLEIGNSVSTRKILLLK